MWPFLTFCFSNIVPELLYQIRSLVYCFLASTTSIEKAASKALEIAYLQENFLLKLHNRGGSHPEAYECILLPDVRICKALLLEPLLFCLSLLIVMFF